jgi:hypothetical protein
MPRGIAIGAVRGGPMTQHLRRGESNARTGFLV